jgi:hypothetical protein
VTDETQTSQADAAQGQSTAVVAPPNALGHGGVDTPGTTHHLDEAPAVARPDLPACPSCHIGVLYTITYDEDARHEQGQPIFAPRSNSGGSAQRKCFHCDYGDSVALNPTVAGPDPRQW